MRTTECKAGFALTAAVICSHCTECFPDNISHRDMSRLLLPLMSARSDTILPSKRDSPELAPHLYFCKVTGNSEIE